MRLSALVPILLVRACLAAEPGCLEFADELMTEGDYYRAVTEYKRFVFLYPDSSEADRARLGIGSALLYAGQFGLMQQWFYRIPDSSPIVSEAAILTARGALDAGMPRVGIDVIDTGMAGADSADLDELRFLRGVSLVHDGAYEEAALEFSSLTGSGAFGVRSGEYLAELSRAPDESPRNPTLAGALGIVPGLGYAYSGHYGTALASLAVNGLLAWGAVSAFDSGNDEAGYALAALGFGFYTGNIYGSAQSAGRYNEYVNSAFQAGFTY